MTAGWPMLKASLGGATTRFARTHDPVLLFLFGGVLAILILASAIGLLLQRTAIGDRARSTIDNLLARTRSWWKMCAIFALTMFMGPAGSLLLFALLSLLAMREYMTLIPTRPGDHRTLLWTFFIITPFQYYLVAIRWYGFFVIMIPAIAFLFIPLRIAVSGETRHFLERAAKIQFGIMICVYCLSYAPALLMLRIPGFESRNARLLFFLVVVTQISDVLKYVFGKIFGRHRIVPRVSPSKTWEGFIGGVLTATAAGAALWRITPFKPLEAAWVSLLVALLGAAGGLVMSAIKRDAEVKDFGGMIEGHGGVLDRIDSLCFAAPAFFHVARYLLVP
ncbi:MAG TPA: phosphatidate cytidylyltransferase [Terracidiphilus sp.]|nr:phosphatidate cytidylyltransferase [Terracidiphilus sp.]